MQFNFSYSQGVSQTQITAFEFAGKIWSSYLTDNITVNLAVDLQSSFPIANVIAGSVARANQSLYTTFDSALKADTKSSIDCAAVGSKANRGGNFAADLQAVNYQTGALINSTQMGNYMELNSANAKALNLNPTNGASVLDGYIVMRDLTGTGISWDYNFGRTSGSSTTTVDFIGVALHEIGHILGFQSSVDQPWIDPTVNRDLYTQSIGNRANIATSLDLFRYSSRGGNSQVDLSPGASPFFSLDGKTALGNLQTGCNTVLGGNGLQGSHWTTGGIMNAEIKKGTVANISQLDLNSFDAIGWDVNSQGANTVINYGQLYTQAQQIASTKTKGSLASAVGLMLDSSDVYLQLTGAETLGTTSARTGTWWQEYFARTTNWWQTFSQTLSAQSVFETLDDGIDEQNPSLSQDVSNIATNPLTGKEDGKALVGETLDKYQLSISNVPQSGNLDFFSASSNSQNNDTLAIAQQIFNNDFDITAIAPISSVLSNIVSFGNKDNLQVAASTSDNFKLDDSRSFAPWWLSEGSLWAVH